MKGSVLETVAPMISDKTAVSFAAMLFVVHIEPTGWLEGPEVETSCKRTAGLNDQAWPLSPHGRMLRAFVGEMLPCVSAACTVSGPCEGGKSDTQYHKVYTRQTRVPMTHRLDTRRILLVKHKLCVIQERGGHATQSTSACVTQERIANIAKVQLHYADQHRYVSGQSKVSAKCLLAAV